MPTRKRPLAEADPNASRAVPNTKHVKTNLVDEYESKSKEQLASSLRGHNLACTGSKQVLIQRLKEHEVFRNREHKPPKPSSTINKRLSPKRPVRQLIRPSISDDNQHENLVTPALEEMVQLDDHSRSDVPIAEIGDTECEGSCTMDYTTKYNSKLRALLRDRGLSSSGTRDELIKRLENSSVDYNTFSSGEITEILKRRQIKCPDGPKDVKIARLKLNDELDRDTGNHEEAVLSGRLSAYELIIQETSRKDFDKLMSTYKALKKELEDKVGYPVNASGNMEEEKRHSDLDMIICRGTRTVPQPICSYQPEEGSHWLSKTERELRDICQRREMPGCGPKAAMIKWLETRIVDYEDLYAFSLEGICRKRGIHYKSGAKKVDLVRLLRDDDGRLHGPDSA